MPSTSVLWAALPWLAFAVFVHLALRRRPRIRRSAAPAAERVPLVSIVVPARNEAANIGSCVGTLINTDYPQREILVVDDRSVDGTDEIARELERRNPGAVRLVMGEPLPEGWVGKCWACWQGYRQARGEVLLFTDADTRHEAALLGHAVGALHEQHAALVSVLPHQRMETFWERTILPHIFTLLSLRYRDLKRINRTHRSRDVIANGQFLLMTREAYEAVGGHEAVHNDLVEDQRLAQRVVAAGRSIYLAHAEDLIDTRMYRSLAGIVEGWTKNLALGSRESVDPWLRPALPWLVGVFLAGFWTLPPLILIATLFGFFTDAVQAWALTTSLASLAFWIIMHIRLRIPLLHAFAFPLGGFMAGLLFIRSALKWPAIEWKGRRYGGGQGGS